MAKKYIPVMINGVEYRVYLENVQKIFKIEIRKRVAIPVYSKKTFSRKISLETSPDSTVYFDVEQQ